MAKFYGVVGFVHPVETAPGIVEEVATEKAYFGDILRNNRRLQSGDKVNDDINISNQISIIADPYANQYFYAMRYVEFMGTKWKVTDIEVQYPRLILTLGGIYNGQQARTASCP